MAPDANVLLAAFRRDHPHHSRAYAWLTYALGACADGDTLELLPMVTAGFLRLATHPKVFFTPSQVAIALRFLDALIAGGATLLQLGSEWPSLRRLCIDRKLAGNAIPAAWVAAAVTTQGLHLVTFDRDFHALLNPSEFTLLKP